MLGAFGRFTASHTRMIFAGIILAAVVAGVGIFQTRINDNYSKRFAMSHPLRQADIALNEHFSVTYPASLGLEKGGGTRHRPTSGKSQKRLHSMHKWKKTGTTVSRPWQPGSFL